MMTVYEELGETSRRQILAELRSGPKTVNDLVSATGMKQPNVSNHLCRMKSRGIVECSRQGRNVYYELASADIHAAVQAAFNASNRPPQSCKCNALTREFFEAVMSGDEDAATEVMSRTFRAQATLVDLYEDLFTPVLRKIGRLQLEGRIDADQKHAACEVVERTMAKAVDVHWQTRGVKPFCVLGCAPSAWHTTGLRMACEYLRGTGWRTMFLGANVPIRSFITAVLHGNPELVLIGCCCSDSLDSTLELIKSLDALRGSECGFKIGVGGNYTMELPCAFLDAGADFAGVSFPEFVEEELPRHVPAPAMAGQA